MVPTSVHMDPLAPKVVKSVIRLSEGRQKVVRGDLFNLFSLMTNVVPESCQNKMTTQRLSRYLKVVTGSSSGSSSVERLS